MNGRISYQDDTIAPFVFETTVTYSCDTGYGMSGGNPVRTCVSSDSGPGEWSGTAPTCEGENTLSCIMYALVCCSVHLSNSQACV